MEKIGGNFNVIENLANLPEKPTPDRITALFKAVEQENKQQIPSNLSKTDLINRIQVLENLTFNKICPKRAWSIFHVATLGISYGCLSIYDNWRAKEILHEKQELLNKYLIQFLTAERPLAVALTEHNDTAEEGVKPLPSAPVLPHANKKEAELRIEELLQVSPKNMHKEILTKILQWALEHQAFPLIQVCRSKMPPLDADESRYNQKLWEQAIYYPWHTSASFSDPSFSLDKIKKIISSGANLDDGFDLWGPRFQKAFPVKLAVSCERYDVAKALILAGANPHLTQRSPQIGYESYTVAHKLLEVAIRDRDMELFDILMQVGSIDLTCRPSMYGPTLLERAYDANNLSMFKRLLEAGANPHTITFKPLLGPETNPRRASSDTTLLTELYKNKNWTFLKALKDAGADLNIVHNGKTLLMEAYENFSKSLIRDPLSNLKTIGKPLISDIDRLREMGANLNIQTEGTTLLMKVFQDNVEWDFIDYLIKAGADPDIQNNHGNSILMDAFEGEKWDLVDNLRKAGASVDLRDKKGESLLLRAIRLGQLDKVQKLLALGADTSAALDKDGNTALMYAVKNQACSLEIINLLKGSAENLNHRNNEGKTALMLAAAEGRQDIMESLLETGADLNIQDNDGNTALMYAVKNQACSLEIINLLKGSAENLNHRNNEGKTALMLVAAEGRQDIMEFLLEKGAELNVQDNKGLTALMYTLPSHYNPALFLIAEGANMEIQDRDGRNVLMRLISEKQTPEQAKALAALINLSINLNKIKY